MQRWSTRLAVTAGLAAMLILAACGTSGSNGGSGTVHLKIMVGGLSKQIYVPNELTQRLGYFQQEGLDVNLIDEASGQSSEEEVLAG
jgi:NitT/TauT family transport system substrate-binding protein